MPETKKTPARGSAKNTPAKVPAKKTASKKTRNSKQEAASNGVDVVESLKDKPQETVLVEPLDRDALQIIVGLIDSAPIKGGDAAVVVKVKLELARVANVQIRG